MEEKRLGQFSGLEYPFDGYFERFERYKKNDDYFFRGYNGKNVTINFDCKTINCPLILNYHRIFALKTADMLFGELPLIDIGDENSDKIDLTELNYIGNNIIIDLMRYGDSIVMVKDNKMNLISPYNWSPYVFGDTFLDVAEIVNYVTKNDDDGYKLILHIQKNDNYCYEEYDLEEKKDATRKKYVIGKLINRIENADIKIFRIKNVMVNDKGIGMDDFSLFNNITDELVVRLNMIEQVLNKHSDPTMEGPSDYLEEDALGGYRFRVGNYHIRNSQDVPSFKYITWEANLDSNFKMVDHLLNQLFIFGESSAALLGYDSKSGQASSGTALRLRMIPPISKASRLKNILTTPLKQIFSFIFKVENINQISIQWQDGLPDDPLEMAQIVTTRTGGKATMSVEKAIKVADRLSNDEITYEINQINEDNKRNLLEFDIEKKDPLLDEEEE